MCKVESDTYENAPNADQGISLDTEHLMKKKLPRRARSTQRHMVDIHPRYLLAHCGSSSSLISRHCTATHPAVEDLSLLTG
ncbi:uncharacterized protein LAJ45_08420 [Morchella importuna]|uniref:uncharacterized protein n=1 Tax=Morchella importuna TaxID=1174673 RepID=UPI001E8D1514|nr:uncharacterized protein LAJ45_08420 [Morchella importuna]KAH8147592.1 hypothetical protein LAJ45_08420 [Morchella importuna]